MNDDLITWLRAQLDDEAREARDAACANPGSAADRWSAEKVDHRSDDGVWRKTWAIVPERVEGIVLAICPADILPRVVTHIARHDPARALRDVEAKRAILDDCSTTIGDVDAVLVCEDACECGDDGVAVGRCRTVRLLALPYADRPGYRKEWAA